MEYYTVEELKEKLEFQDYLILKRIIDNKQFGVKEIYIENKKQYFFEKKQVDEYISERNEKYTPFNDVAKSYNISTQKLSKAIKLGLISYKKYELAKTIYIYNEDIPKLLDIDKFKVKNVFEELDMDNELINKEYYSIEEVNRKYGISEENIRISINKGLVKGYKKGRFKYLLKADIDNYFEELNTNYIKMNEANKKYCISNNLFRKHIKILKDIKTYDKHLFNTYNVYLYIPDVEKAKENIEKQRLINNEAKIEDKIELLFNESEYKKFPNTLRYCINYAKYSVSNSNRTNKEAYIKLIYRSYERFAEVLKKEITEYSNDELEFLFDNNTILFENKREMGYFLRYCIQEMPNKCKFTDYPKTYPKIIGKKENDIYDKEKWIKYFEILTNIDLHIKKAFEDNKYANIWLYSLLHFSLMWRKADILKIPLFALPIKGIDNIKWFEENVFTLSDAETILNSLSISIKSMITDKTDARTNFVTPHQLRLATAVALICSYQYAKQEKSGFIFSRKTSWFHTKNINDFFTNYNLPGFSSRKANNTLGTLGYESGVNKEGMAHITYSMISDMRSHKYNPKTMVSESTSYYIATNIGDYKTIDDVSHNLFLRGHFGELYHMLVEIAYGNIDNLEIKDVTKIIKNMKNRIAPKSLETTASFLLSPKINDVELEEVIRELLTTDKSELKEKINNILSCKMPSKVNNIQCFISPKCIKKNGVDEISCVWCKYSLPTIYVLKEIENLIYKLVDRYKFTQKDSIEIMKYKYMLSQCIKIILIAKKEYSDYGDNEYIETLIDIDKIKKLTTPIFL